MKPIHILCATVFALAAPVQAQPATDHAAHHAAPAPAAAPASDGEVRKVDKAQAKITLKHGPIVNLDMPGMTMVFKVADPKLLDAVKPGDKVKFTAESVNGALTVTAIDLVK